MGDRVKLLHFALLSEAIYFIEKYKAIKINSTPKIYKSKDFYILIGGVGKAKTKNSLEYFLANFEVKKAFNIGIAAINSKKVEVGELFCTTHNLPHIKYAPLITSTAPVTTSTKKELTLYDMEGEIFFNILQKKLSKEDIYIFKVVSDYLENKILPKAFIKSLFIKRFKEIDYYLKQD